MSRVSGPGTWVAIGTLVALLVAFGHRERSSVERANRLHRDRDWLAAATLYRGHLGPGSDTGDQGALPGPTDARADEPIHYNLGTTLLALGDHPAAEANLARALSTAGDDLRTRALYNIGVGQLFRAIDSPDPDSAMIHAALALAANKDVLRSVPGHEPAAWNLAFAQRMLDSLDVDAAQTGVQAGGDMDDAELARSETTGDAAAEEVQVPPTASGEDETVVDRESEIVMSLTDAAAILATMRLDGELITRKLLALEGRSRLGNRRGSSGRRW